MQLTIQIHSDRRWSYASAGTRRPLVRGVYLEQSGSLPDRDIRVVPRVTLDFPLPEPVAETWTASSPRLLEARGEHIGETISWDRINLKLNYPLLGRLQEKVRGVIKVEIVDIDTDQVLASESQELELLAPNEFRQEADYLELIAAYVLPTDPFVSDILQSTRVLLDQRTGSASTEGYQRDKENPVDTPIEATRAYEIAHAVYDAMSEFQYAYSNPQGYFESGAQRVRTPSQIKAENCATCLDSAVLMASCFAQAGLEPVIFMIEGHAFAGYFTGRPIAVGKNIYSGDEAVSIWLNRLKSRGLTQLLKSRDYSLLQDLLHGGHILPIETTTTTRDSHKPFREACQRQNNFTIIDDERLEGIVVVKLAWLAGVTPPIVINKSVAPLAEWEIADVVDPRADNEQATQITELSDLAVSSEERSIPPRIRQWMASLLDLGSRNPLLKIKPKQMMEFDLPPSVIGKLDDQLFTPRARIKIPNFSSLPYAWVHDGVSDGEFEKWSSKEPVLVYPSYKEFNRIQEAVESKLREIRSNPDAKESIKWRVTVARSLRRPDTYDPSDAEVVQTLREIILANHDAALGRTAKKLIDKASDVMLMTGNNSLYLALGTVAWTETSNFRGRDKATSWCAPLYLYPVILDGGKGRPWTLRLDPNGEVTPNFCLHEKLKRAPYNIDLQELVNPEEDEKGINFDKMVKAIKKRLEQAKLDNVAIQPRAVLGVFDYTNFRLWKDLRDDWKKMAEISPVFKHVSHTANQPYGGNPPVPDKRLEPLLPIAADDSQRAAVQMALDGQSFKLEGPPGTGKSQTITNLLASCIAHNRKVLFVAEKQTALDAVKKRLDAAGLGAFCLNLHAKGDSDTKIRKNISAALTVALNAAIDPADDAWGDIEFRLSREQAALDRYKDALHEPAGNGISVWGANEQLLRLGDGAVVELPDGFVSNLGEQSAAVRDVSIELENALDLVPEPLNHPWRLVGLVDPTTVNFVSLTRCLVSLLEASTRLASVPGTSKELRSMVTVKTLEHVSNGVALQREGLLPPADVLNVDDSARRLAALATFRQAAETLSREVAHLCNALAQHADHVSPSIIERADRAEIRKMIDDIGSQTLADRLSEMERTWALIAREVSALESSVGFEPIAVSRIPDAQRSVESANAAIQHPEFEQLVAQLRSLQPRVKEHERHVSASIVARADLSDIEFRLKEVSEAGALTRGRKTKALREALGSDAKSSDDRLFVNAVTQLLPLAREVRDVIGQIRTKFPEVSTEQLRPWESTELDELSNALLKARVQTLREAGYITSGSDDDRRFLAAVAVSLKVSPMIDEARRSALDVLPNVDSDTIRPWISGEFEAFRRRVVDTRSREVVSLLGSDARGSDPTRVVEAARAFLIEADRIAGAERVLRNEVFPQFAEQFSPWNTAVANVIGQGVSRVEGLLAAADDASLLILVDSIQRSVTPSLADVLAEGSLAWTRLSELVPLTEVETWMRGRALFDAIAEEVPALWRDAGEHDNYIEFHRWQELQSACHKIQSLGLGVLLPDLLSRTLSPTEFLSCVSRSALSQALRLRMQEENLDRFDRKVHERRIAEFERALNDARKLLNQRIPGLAASRRKARRLPTGVEIGATQDLLRGLKPKRGEKTPIRDLVSQYGNALAEAMPCFLMSPDSVASLLPVGAVDFDLVVFDEASQIRTSHAVGALGRGSASIVVGDSRQMPPSTAFVSNAGTMVEDDDDDAVDEIDPEDDDDNGILRPVAARDAESVLTEFEESDFPQLQLLCHYRSKDEVLISFSNTFIYSEPMLTFPSPAGLQSTSLRYVHVADGMFERDRRAPSIPMGPGAEPVPALRTNLREAELIVDEVISRLTNRARRARRDADPTKSAESIIVVTFNAPQQALITAMLKARNPELIEAALAATVLDDEAETQLPPQLKIRNLENVQGDEAETVIFSVAFSKTRDGKFPLNFGPVTRSGGERRLNVAVTRAQREMIVYASFLPDEMTANNKTLGEEARLLQAFLKLAYRGASASGDVGIFVPQSRQIESVANELRALGFEAQTQLGLSTLRVDIALRRPGSERWEIAIMVDDTCWATRGSAFQREVLPRQVLPDMGWKRVYRIWFPAWKNSKEEIISELRPLLEADLDEQPPVVEEQLDDAHDDATPHSTDAPVSSGSPASERQQPPSSSDNRVNPGADGFLEFEPFAGEGEGGPEVLYAGAQDKTARQAITAVVQRVIAAEAPIEANRLGRTVCRAFGFNRVVEARVNDILRLVPRDQFKKDAIGRFVWREAFEWERWTQYRTSIGQATRTPNEISVVEYGNALVDFVRKAHSIEHEDAVKELSKVFGFQRLTAQIRSTIEKAMKEIVKSGAIELTGEVYRIPK